jgi:hypothetical protein
MSPYNDLPYPQSLAPLEIVPTVEAHFEDPNFKLRENNTINGGSGILTPSKNKNELNPTTYQRNEVDDDGNVTPVGVGIFSFLRPAYDANKKTHVYKRSEFSQLTQEYTLSNSDQVSYNDLIFGEYIHYLPNPMGGRGLLDTSPHAVKTDVTISRNLRVATYSPY